MKDCGDAKEKETEDRVEMNNRAVHKELAEWNHCFFLKGNHNEDKPLLLGKIRLKKPLLAATSCTGT